MVTAMTLQAKSPLKVCHRLLRKKSSAVSEKSERERGKKTFGIPILTCV